MSTLNSIRIPVQRNGFRYIPARQVPDSQPPAYEEDHWQDKVTLSLHDRCREVELDWCQSRQEAWGGPLGYRSIMASHGTTEYGAFYYEIEVGACEDASDPHVRLGLVRVGASLLGPVGMDSRGYGFSESGHYLHQAKKTPAFDTKGLPLIFKQGDRVGCSIIIRSTSDIAFPPEEPKYKLVEYFRSYFEMPVPRSSSEELPLMDAEIRFHVNGKFSAVPVVTRLPVAVYYPMISMYRGAKVRFIPDEADMLHLPEGYQPWSTLFKVRRIEYAVAPVPISSQMAGSKETEVETGMPTQLSEACNMEISVPD